MEAIPYVELRSRTEECRPELDARIADVLDSGLFIGGEVVERFEARWAEYCGVKHCIGVGNGLDALRLALLAHGIGPGDEVLVPAQTFIATWLAVLQTGATPVGVDICSNSPNMDPVLAAAAVTPRTAAIIVVHLHGWLADMDAFRSVASKHGLLLLEDAAQAHGAQRDGIRAGAWGDAAAFSFYPTKNLGAVGDAGAVTTSDDVIAERVRRLRSYGADAGDKYRHLAVGWNSRLDPLQAASLDVFLPRLEDWNARRRQIAKRYIDAASSELGDIVGGTYPDDCDRVWHHFVLRSVSRDRSIHQLEQAKIRFEIHYPQLPAASEALRGDAVQAHLKFPNAAAHAASVVSIPLHPWLAVEEVTRVAEWLEGMSTWKTDLK